MSLARKPVGGVKPLSDDGLHVAPQSGIETTREGLEHVQHPQYYNYPQQQYPPYSPPSTHTGKPEHEQDVQPRQERKKLCGIPLLAFWLLLLLIVALVAAVAVVGGVLGSRHTSSPKPTVTPTVTVSSPPTTVTSTAAAVSATGAFDCTKNGTIFTSATGSTFTTLCGDDLGMGKAFNNTFADLTVVHVDSYGACIDACALSRQEGITWNAANGSCAAVIWVSGGSSYGDCWLKNGTGKPHYNPIVYAAILLTS